mgnify:CR=1 FL=1
MRVTYDRHTDTLSIVFSDALVTESDEAKPGVILDFDADGRIVGLEILDASTSVQQPTDVDDEIAS